MNPNRPIAEKILKNVDQLSAEDFIGQTYAVTGHPWLVSKKIKLPERYRTAFALLLQILSERPTPTVRTRAQPRIPREEIVPPGAKIPPGRAKALPNHYAVLGVSENASFEEIRKEYRKLAKEYHPDVLISQGLSDEEMAVATARMQNYNDAWLVLSKKEGRTLYDEVRTSPPPPPPRPPTERPEQRAPGPSISIPTKVPEKIGPVKIKAPKAVKAVTKTRAAAKKGIASGVKKTGGSLLKLGGKLLARLGLREVISNLAAALTLVTGPLAVIIGPIVKALTWVATWIAEKVISKIANFVRRHKEDIAIALLGIGLLMGSPLILGGGLLLTGIAGPAAIIGRVGLLVSAFSAAILAMLIPAFGIPLIISFIVTILTVALVVFIINSGAYIVPPGAFSVVEENPDIGVVKEANPSGPFANGDLPLSITYTITVTARRGALTNITFAHECEVIRKGTTDTCPAPLPGTTPTVISPVEPFVYTYTQTYSGSKYIDSLVINTFTVTADTPEVQQTTASGATSIIIGTPPTACYVVSGNWPAAEQAMLLSAISNLVGNSPRYIQRLCSVQSQVNLIYDPSRVCGIWGCAPIGGNTIFFNSGGFGNLTNATYILAHESGHILAYGAPQLYAAYLAFPGTLSELPVCKGYGGLDPNEGFAEAIAKYAINDSCMANTSSNFQFVDTQIFR